MKIYTKTGDKGYTSLIGGKRVPKFHTRIEAYGTIDELISYLGLIRDQPGISIVDIKKIIDIQSCLMVCSAIVATDCENCNDQIPILNEDDILPLEQSIDEMEKMLKPLHNFIIPGGNIIVSHCHVARTICRRAERYVLRLSQESIVPEDVVQYLNRLSDFLFVLARKFSADFQAIEIPWLPTLQK